MAKLLMERLILRLLGRRWCEWIELWLGLSWEVGVFYWAFMFIRNMPKMTSAIPMNWVVEIFSL